MVRYYNGSVEGTENKNNMKHTIRIGILGDFNTNKLSHRATNASILHAAKELSIEADISWIPTPSLLDKEKQLGLAKFDCMWASSGGPYQSTEGMLKGIQAARKMDKPFFGT